MSKREFTFEFESLRGGACIPRDCRDVEHVTLQTAPREECSHCGQTIAEALPFFNCPPSHAGSGEIVSGPFTGWAGAL